MFKSIKIKFLVTQLGFVLAMTVVLGLATYFIMFRSLRDNQLHYLEYVSVTTGEKLNLLVDGKERLLEKIANSEMMSNYTRKQSENMLVAYFSKFVPEFSSLSYVNEKGIKEVELVNGQTTGEFLDKTESVLVEQLKRNPNKTLNAYVPFSSETGGPCIEFGFFHKSFFDEFVGIILGRVSVAELSKSIRDSRVGKTGFVMLLDSQGTILSCKDPDSTVRNLVIDGAELKKVMAGIKMGRSGSGRANILGVDSFFAYAPVYKHHLTVMAVLPHREFAAALDELRNTVLVVGFNILVLGAISSLLLAKNITGPISKLVKGTVSIAKGDFSHKIPIASQDEIGTLAASFNRMAEDLGKTTTSVINLNREISERKQAEKALRQSLSLLNATLESTADGILVIDRKGKVAGLNQKFLHLWRIPQSVADRKDDKALLSYVLNQLKTPETFLAKVEQLYSKPDASSEDIVEFNDGRIFERHSQPQKLGQRTVGRVWSFRDITERKRAEDAIKNLNKDLESTVALLTQSNRQLNEFAHLAAHDLKTPLRGIATLAQWLVDDYKEKFDDEGRRQMDLMVKRVKRMNEIIDAILRYSTVGRNGNNERPVDLNELLKKVLVEIEPPGNVKVTVSKKLPVVICEEDHLREVFYNLLDNAVRFIDKPDGLITIDGTDRKDDWVFSITDNGPGIAKQHFERIFRLFQTLNDSDQSEGSGAGLTFVRKIVELYGGRVWLTSEPGSGSTFFFSFPKVLRVVDNQQLVPAAASS